MAQAPRSVIILGGGTAGWMTANLLHRRWADSGTKVALVESPEIGIIGVGEGSTPQLKAFFDEIGISEAEWMPRCNATYKAGIEFVGWSERPGTSAISTPSRPSSTISRKPVSSMRPAPAAPAATFPLTPTPSSSQRGSRARDERRSLRPTFPLPSATATTSTPS